MLSSSELSEAEANFHGEWLDDENSLVFVKDGFMYGDDGNTIDINFTSATTCTFTAEDEQYDGTLVDERTIEWNDGAVWTLKSKEVALAPPLPRRSPIAASDVVKAQSMTNGNHDRAKASNSSAERSGQVIDGAFEEVGLDAEARRAAARERVRNRMACQQDEQLPADQIFGKGRDLETDRASPVSDDKTRKAAALERARQKAQLAQIAAEQDENLPRNDNINQDEDFAGADRRKAALERARAKTNQGQENKVETGINRARQAYEEEKARKSAALERARQKTAQAVQAAQSGGHSAMEPVELSKAGHDQTMDRTRRAFEEEKFKKTAALERARAAREAAAAEHGGGRSTELGANRPLAGINGARRVFEEEQARKAAALERARARKAEAESLSWADGDRPQTLSSINRAKAAFEEEKARKAAALERARARATEAAQGLARGPGGRSTPQANRTLGAGNRFSGDRSSANGYAAPSGMSSLGFRGQPGGGLGLRAAKEGSQLRQGMYVRMKGLKAKPELNGVVGLLVTFDRRKERWQVRYDSGDDILLKEQNLEQVSQSEFEEMQDDSQGEDARLEAEAKELATHTRATGGKVRLCEDREGGIERGPGDQGNEFDVIMADENDGIVAAEKVVNCLKAQGVCCVEANAQYELLGQGFEEAEALYQDNDYGMPWTPDSEDGGMAAQIWTEMLTRDENKTLWVKPDDVDSRMAMKTKALTTLSESMLEFVRGLGDVLLKKTGIKFTHVWNSMLSCYTGDREYCVHLDNPHGCGSDGHRMPDNGLRLTMCYYINVHWNPEEGYNGGGLDVFLTDPTSAPSDASTARQAKRFRIAPHADTLVLFLSERMAHQVIRTEDSQRWYCLTMWCFDKAVTEQFIPAVSEIRQLEWKRQGNEESDEDLD